MGNNYLQLMIEGGMSRTRELMKLRTILNDAFGFLIIFPIFIQAQGKEILNVYARGGPETRVVYTNGDDHDHYEEQEVKYYPYHFGYDIKDHLNNLQWYKEESDEEGIKKGTYGYKDAKGLYRHVEYIADDKGFRVNIKTNEPGMANISPASVSIEAEHPPPSSHPPSPSHPHPDPQPHPPPRPPPKPGQPEKSEHEYTKETRLPFPLFALHPTGPIDFSL